MNPDKYTIKEQFVPVGEGHELYVHEWGNPKAKTTILFLHGGPGSGVKDRYKQIFEPDQHRVVFFDQRGCGKSIPKGSLEHNTTQDLVEDIEKLAVKLKLNSFVITGGSWGSCLALAYALKYPKRVQAMVLRGIFTGSRAEIDWVHKGHFRIFFPDVWDEIVSKTPQKYRHDPMSYHRNRILGKSQSAAKESAYIYSNTLASLLSIDDRFTPADVETFDQTPITIEVHYDSKGCFLEERFILQNAHKLKMPVWFIQGRYDMVCPPITAYELYQQVPNSQIVWTTAGHGNDRANYDANRTILLQWS